MLRRSAPRPAVGPDAPAAPAEQLIPYNPTGLYDGSSREVIERFKAVLEWRAFRPPCG